MAARRRASEDKNTKLLRELASLPANKQCFDCFQRGPTYINVTIGSFVCTSCSGILRGLTPPHRVKSISMTTFTPEEIEQLKCRGNEYCRYVWLGTYDTNASNLENEVSDDIRKRDFMSQKYERKRWYVDPEIATKKMQLSGQFQKLKQIPETQPLSRLLGRTPTPLVVQNHQQSPEVWPHPVSSASAPAISTKTTSYKYTSDGLPQAHGSRSIDLLSEFAGDGFAVPASNASTATTTSSSANGNFANFANFETAFSSGTKDPSQPSFQSSNHRKNCTLPGWTSFEDELGPLNPAIASSSVISTLSNEALSCISSSSSVIPRPLSLPTFAPTNPFKSPSLINNVGCPGMPTQWSSFAANSSAMPAPSLPSSASLDAYPKSMQQNVTTGMASLTSSVTSEQQSNADRYAALADLDSLFHQPVSTNAPSWTVDNTITTTSASSSYFDTTTTSESSTNIYSTAPSNPFSSAQLWSQLPVSKSQDSFQPVNPFQSMGSDRLPYTQQQGNQAYAPFPIPLVGNSPSEDANRNQFGTGYAMFSTQPPVTSPSNGFHSGQRMMQNGGFVSPTSGGTGSWGVPTATSQTVWPSSQLGPGGLFSSDHKTTEVAQHADWIQNPVNPFMASSASMGFQPAPRHNSSNPFL